MKGRKTYHGDDLPRPVGVPLELLVDLVVVGFFSSLLETLEEQAELVVLEGVGEAVGGVELVLEDQVRQLDDLAQAGVQTPDLDPALAAVDEAEEGDVGSGVVGDGIVLGVAVLVV